ncbi:HD domain-containing phosphohydrolase [Salinibius halmophilus]|uniref:HD domain-containing phosphohydrolase n=1 Tax=Salinibius halmophilus TaxID=1853216 RepID=UPI000E66E063|nr:HD domain-containing phosphohydrolase [Salinibius halmophilus]
MTELTPTYRAELLFVDDDPMVLAALRRAMRKEPYRIHIAESGAQALEILDEHEITIVVSDMRMPQMNGAELLAEVRRRKPEVISLLLTGQADLSDTINAINSGGIFRFMSKPWDDLQLKASIQAALEIIETKRERDKLLTLTRRQNQLLAKMNKGLSEKVNQSSAELEQSLLMVDASYNAMRDSIHGFVRLFSQMAESRDGMVAGIADNAAALACILAKHAGLSAEQMIHIEHAVLLHEIGKIMMPERVVSKPEAALSKIELELYRQYPSNGYNMLMSIDYLRDAASIILQHREHWVGNGFPNRLGSEDIKIEARIAAIAIAFFAFKAGTRTGAPMSNDEALSSVKKLADKYFDPELCEQLDEAIEALEEHRVELDAGRRRVSDLVEGNIVTRNLISKDGFMLVTAGTQLSEGMIERLKGIIEEHEEDYIVYVAPMPEEEDDSTE